MVHCEKLLEGGRGDGGLLRQCGCLPGAVAAVLVQDGDWLLENLHVTPIENNEISSCQGATTRQLWRAGADVVALGGGKLVETGYANGNVPAARLAAAITPRTAIFSISNLTTVCRKNMLSAWSRLRWWRARIISR